jgi:hypothetical protein
MQVEFIECSRCSKRVRSCSGETFTAGYYELKGYWQRFAQKDEVYLCDECMFLEPGYIQVYGDQREIHAIH